MQSHGWEPIASAAEIFALAGRQLQAAVDIADHLGLTIPDSFPDAIDHLHDWTSCARTEVQALLPANAARATCSPGVLEGESTPPTVATRAAD
jgi:hypothetical protein